MRVPGVILAALALAFPLAGSAGSAHVSGLHGVVMRGPTKPVCREGEPCMEPAKGLLLQFRRGGTVVAQVKTTQGGTYRIRLRRGRYAVTTPNLRPWQDLTPHAVRVPRGRISRVDFHFDTGIQ